MRTHNSNGFSFIRMLLTIVLIGAAYYLIMKLSLSGFLGHNRDVIQTAGDVGINTSSYAELVKSAKDVVADANAKLIKQDEDMQKQLDTH